MESIDSTTLSRLIESALVLSVALFLFYGSRGRISKFTAWAGVPRLALAPVGLMLRSVLLFAAAAVVLTIWGFQLGTIMAVLGSVLGLVAIGFVAVWSVLSNLLCTFVLVAFKPFAVGDEIEFPVDNVKGRVSDLSLIFTTLKVSETESVLIPNNTFFQRLFRRRLGTRTCHLADQLRQSEPADVPAPEQASDRPATRVSAPAGS